VFFGLFVLNFEVVVLVFCSGVLDCCLVFGLVFAWRIGNVLVVFLWFGW